MEPIRRALEPLAERVTAAFIYGSFAKGSDSADSDIDLFIVAEDIGYPEAFSALQSVESELGRSVNPNVMTVREWREKSGERDSFAARIASQPRLFVIGTADDIS